MICKNCGATIPEGSSICPSCGTNNVVSPVVEQPAQPQAVQPQPAQQPSAPVQPQSVPTNPVNPQPVVNNIPNGNTVPTPNNVNPTMVNNVGLNNNPMPTPETNNQGVVPTANPVQPQVPTEPTMVNNGSPTVTPNNNQPKKKNNLIFIIIIAVLVLAIIIVSVVLFMGNNKTSKATTNANNNQTEAPTTTQKPEEKDEYYTFNNLKFKKTDNLSYADYNDQVFSVTTEKNMLYRVAPISMNYDTAYLGREEIANKLTALGLTGLEYNEVTYAGTRFLIYLSNEHIVIYTKLNSTSVIEVCIDDITNASSAEQLLDDIIKIVSSYDTTSTTAAGTTEEINPHINTESSNTTGNLKSIDILHPATTEQ